MTVENNSEEKSPLEEIENKKDYFIDHFDFNTRRKIIGVAAGFGADFENIVFMAHKKEGAEVMTQEELIKALPKDIRKRLQEKE